MGNTTYGRTVVISATNKSGGGLIAGDVCVIDTTNNLAFTTDTSGGFVGTVGIAQGTIANNAAGLFAISGYVSLVNVNASVTRGHYGKTYTVAKQATDAGASRGVGTFCEFTTGGTTPDAIMWPVDLLGSSLTNPMDGTGQMIYGGSAGAPTKLAAGTTTQLLHGSSTVPSWSGLAVADITSTAIDNLLPWRVEIVPMISTPSATTGTWSIIQFSDSALVFPFTYSALTNATAVAFYNSSSAQNDAFSYNVILAAGTWDCNMWVRKSSNTGIITLNQDGSSQGTADTYAASAAAAKVSITGWTVATTGKHVMQFKAATKNASSSNYLLEMFGIEFNRTA